MHNDPHQFTDEHTNERTIVILFIATVFLSSSLFYFGSIAVLYQVRYILVLHMVCMILLIYRNVLPFSSSPLLSTVIISVRSAGPPSHFNLPTTKKTSISAPTGQLLTFRVILRRHCKEDSLIVLYLFLLG